MGLFVVLHFGRCCVCVCFTCCLLLVLVSVWLFNCVGLDCFLAIGVVSCFNWLFAILVIACC